MQDFEGAFRPSKYPPFHHSHSFCVQQAHSPHAKKGQTCSNALLDALEFFVPPYTELNQLERFLMEGSAVVICLI